MLIIKSPTGRFPKEGPLAKLSEYTYIAERMGSAPSLTASLLYPRCLDSEWTGKEFVEYNGEKYVILNTPSSEKNYEDTRFKHDITFVSERVILENEFFYDVVTEYTEQQYADRYRSNLTDFKFYGTLKEFVARLNDSLIYTKICKPIKDNLGVIIGYDGYHVVLDKGIRGEEQNVEFSNKYFAEALQEINTTYKHPYYFVGKEIHVGYTQNVIDKPFEYGADNGLLKVQKQNSNNKICDRITGTGGSTNIPYYYPNSNPAGDTTSTVENALFPDTALDHIELSKVLHYNTNAVGSTFELEWHPESVEINKDTPEVQKGFSRYDETTKDRTERIIVDITCARIYVKKGDYVRIGIPELYVYERDVSWNEDSFPWGALPDNNMYDDMFTKPYVSVMPHVKEGDIDIIVTRNAPGGGVVAMGKRPEFIANEDCEMSVTAYVTVTYQVPYATGPVYTYNDSDPWERGAMIQTTKFSIGFKVGYSISHRYPNNGGYSFRYGDNQLVKYDISGIYLNNIEKQNAKTYSVEYIDGQGFMSKLVPGKEHGMRVTINSRKWIPPTRNIMPSIYRASGGAERYYPAVSEVYADENGKLYTYENLYDEDNPHAANQSFDNIKPSIVGMKNDIGEGQLFGEIAEVAVDNNDSDLYVIQNGKETTELAHPYFYIKLHKFSGPMGFNLFQQALEQGEMQIEMTSGNCASCVFTIMAVNREQVGNRYTFKNPVIVDYKGNLVRYSAQDNVDASYHGNVKILTKGRADELSQNNQDTTQNEIWLCVTKDSSTYNVLMPNAKGNHRPAAGDTFVFTNILLPEQYIRAAEKRLDEALYAYMKGNNVEKFNFNVDFSRIFLKRNPDIAKLINENARIFVRYNNEDIPLYVKTYSVKTSEDILEEVSVSLVDEVTVSQNSLALKIKEAVEDVNAHYSGGGGTSDFPLLAAQLKDLFLNLSEDATKEQRTAKGKVFLDNGAEIDGDTDIDGNINISGDSTIGGNASINGNTSIKGNAAIMGGATIENGITTSDFSSDNSGIQGFALKPVYGNDGNISRFFEMCVHNLNVSGTFKVNSLQVNKAYAVNGGIWMTKASMVIKSVEVVSLKPISTFRLYFNAKGDKGQIITNDFMPGDYAYCRTYNLLNANRVYWAEVVETGEGEGEHEGEKFITVAMNSEKFTNVPSVGDSVVQLGNKDNKERQGASLLDSDSFSIFVGITSNSSFPEPIIRLSPYGIDFSAKYIKFGTDGSSVHDKLNSIPEITKGQFMLSDTMVQLGNGIFERNENGDLVLKQGASITTAINNDGSEVKLNGDRIDVNGIFSVNEEKELNANIVIRRDGSMKAKDAEFDNCKLNGRLYTTFVNASGSDAIRTDYRNESWRKLNKNISLAADGANILLPADVSYEGARVVLVNNTYPTTRAYVGDFRTKVAAESKYLTDNNGDMIAFDGAIYGSVVFAGDDENKYYNPCCSSVRFLGGTIELTLVRIYDKVDKLTKFQWVIISHTEFCSLWLNDRQSKRSLIDYNLEP